ncbi:MAG: hypothetical protein K0R34_4325, partial [Herbinix sp.]|nr:hypothetical protein [Herbinix sp.]
MGRFITKVMATLIVCGNLIQEHGLLAQQFLT